VAAGERSRYGTALLDEYQDTGHAQRILLRSLFGGEKPMPVTAVGDRGLRDLR
jgi:DNA helicase-2/ATP-dependent DNA helicase PcrA